MNITCKTLFGHRSHAATAIGVRYQIKDGSSRGIEARSYSIFSLAASKLLLDCFVTIDRTRQGIPVELPDSSLKAVMALSHPNNE